MGARYMQQTVVLLLGGLLALPTSIAQSNCAQPVVARDPKFAPGQVWSYKTRFGEERSTVTILRIEKTPKMGTIVHIRIEGVHFSNCTGGPAPDLIAHAPFARAALEESVISKITTVKSLPDYESGYHDWLSHCGGAYTISVAHAVAIDDAQFGVSVGCPAL